MDARRGLIWGIKDSFLLYVGAIPDGICEVSGGVAPHSAGRFFFPPTHIEGAFAGTLRVTAYGGILDVTVASPRIISSVDGQELVVETLDNARPVMRVASLQSVESDGAGIAEYEATLLADAGSWLGDAYAVGTRLDRVTVV